MAGKKAPPRRGRFGRVTGVRFAEVEFERPRASGMVVEVEGGLRLLVADEASVALAAQLLNGLWGAPARPRPRKGVRGELSSGHRHSRP